MTNDRLSALEVKFDARQEARDAEIHELATLVARNGEIANSVASELARIRSDLGALRDRQPGFIQLWGPTILTVTLATSALAFMMQQTIAPLDHDIANIVGDVAIRRENELVIANRQRENEAVINYQRGRNDALEQQVRDIDKGGARYWVKEAPLSEQIK